MSQRNQDRFINFYDFFSQPETGNVEIYIFQKTIDLVILKPIQKSSYNHPLQKTSSKNHPLPPPSSLLHIASILCVSIFLSFPFLPVPYPFPFPSSCFHVPSPFSVFSSLSSPILFALPCSFFPFSLFLFLRLTGKAKSCKPSCFFKKIIEKSSNNLRKSSPTHIFWAKPPSQWSGKQKVAKPSCFFKNHRKIFPNPHFLDQPVRKAKSCKTLLFFQKIIEKSSNNLRKIIEKSSKIIPNPHFLDQPPFTVVRKAKSCKTLLFFFQKIIENSSKNHRKIFEKSSPTQIFWTNPPSQWSGKQKVAKPSCFFKNHRTIFEKSSKNLRKIFEKSS